MIKYQADQYAVVCKISVPPALVEKAFGKGFIANRNGNFATKEWDFTDSNNDTFLVYDYKATQNFWGPNLAPEEYEVNNFVTKRLRTTKIRRFWRQPRPTFNEFWADDQNAHDFRVNCNDHAEYRKFKTWFISRIEAAKTDPKSYDQKVVEKFGLVETYSDYDKKYQIDTDYVVLRHSRQDFADPKWKPTTEYDKPFTTGKRLEDKYRLL